MARKVALDTISVPRKGEAPRPADPVATAAPKTPPKPEAKPERMHRVTIDLEPGLYRRLKLASLDQNRRLADIVRELLDAHLPR